MFVSQKKFQPAFRASNGDFQAPPAAISWMGVDVPLIVSKVYCYVPLGFELTQWRIATGTQTVDWEVALVHDVEERTANAIEQHKI